MKRAAIYARVSTKKEEQKNALGASVGRLIDYCRSREWTLDPAHIYTDMLSGNENARPSYQKMREVIRQRGIDVVVATKLDRLARSTRELLAFSDELQKYEVSLMLLDQSIDTGTASGRLLFTVIAAVAEFERELICDRVKRGMEKAKSKGVRFGKAITNADLESMVVALKKSGASLNGIVLAVKKEGRTVTRSWVRRVLCRQADLSGGVDRGVPTTGLVGTGEKRSDQNEKQSQTDTAQHLTDTGGPS